MSLVRFNISVWADNETKELILVASQTFEEWLKRNKVETDCITFETTHETKKYERTHDRVTS